MKRCRPKRWRRVLPPLGVLAGLAMAPEGALATDYAHRMIGGLPGGHIDARSFEHLSSSTMQMPPQKQLAARQSVGQGPMMMQMMDPDAMGRQDRGPGGGQLGAGNRVVPIPHLGAEDVRHFFEHRLELQGFERLEVGSVDPVDDEAILLEIMTSDGTVVQEFEIDRHTGVFQTSP